MFGLRVTHRLAVQVQRRGIHSFDTYALAHALEKEAKVDRKAAETLTINLQKVTAENTLEISERAVARETFDKFVFSHNADFNRLRNELGLVEKNDFLLLKSEVTRLAADLEKLQLRSAEEFRRIQTNTRLELSMEKSRIRDEHNAQHIRMKEADAKVESELAAIKTVLEGIHWDLFKTLFPLFSAAGALAFSYLRFVR
ncbi:DUF1640-domain-containing protein [Rhizoclosmatium globosum]|uniref:DUF1640-domain-containing protein n=1 Tax=Rhizoclosmatium globosum TaxID=329046 RepID=A0A1Y2CCZ0_9FUNG|nr:DUF1640-domain-containing protein [Rhizoclosmatium globosum]|eukprot:ORY44902.1 DUF1640-domain-containing protein [Rhizoclosmatium globosum]